MTHREKLPRARRGHTSRFEIGVAPNQLSGYMTVGVYEDGQPGEVFLKASKTGSTMQGVLDGLAIMISHALQYGMPLSEVVSALGGLRFEPMGTTGDEDVTFAASICDYIAKKLAHDYPSLVDAA